MIPIEDMDIYLEAKYKENKEKEIRKTMNKIYIVDFCDNEGESWDGVACPTLELAQKKAKERIERIFNGKDIIVDESGYATIKYYKHKLLENIDKYKERKEVYPEEQYVNYVYSIGVALRIGEFPLIFNL